MNRANAQRLVALTFVLVACVSLDQVTKVVARSQLSATEPLFFLNGLVRLQYAENSGAFLSLGAGLPAPVQSWLFIALVPLVLVGLLYFVLKDARHISLPMLIASALLLGGGIGNLIDRLVNEGRVIDFMNVGIGSLRTGVFNVADMAIMAGVGLMILSALRGDQAPA